MTYIFVGIVAVIVLWLVFVYNGLIRGRQRIKEAWSDIEVQLKRRYDLIPNLVAAVKGYAAHENNLFENVTKARTQAMGARTAEEHAKAENMLSSTLKSLFAVAEAYPDLKANTNFLELQRELSDTENKIQAARRFYNGNVRDFNIMIESFPSSIVASVFHFMKSEFFDMDEGEKANPKVSF